MILRTATCSSTKYDTTSLSLPLATGLSSDLAILPNVGALRPERGGVDLTSIPSSLVGINGKEECCFHSSPVSSLTWVVAGGGEGFRLLEEEDA